VSFKINLVPIAQKLKFDSSNFDVSFKITYIDLDDNGDDLVSFITVPKAAELIAKKLNIDTTSEDIEISRYNLFRENDTDSDVYKKNRVSTTIGRFINKLYPNEFTASGKPGEDIESFTTLFKSFRKKKNGEFEIVQGSNISYWYYEDNYSDDADDDTSLGNSCMKYGDCEEFLEFYDKNIAKVSLLILKEASENKITGRALIWNLTEPKDRIFMDRIYVTDHVDEQLFKNYAIEKGWLYKERQSYSYQQIVDPLGKCDRNETLVVKDMKRHKYFPYMDSLHYYSSDFQILSNKESYFENYKYKEFLGDRYIDDIGITCYDLQNDQGGPDTTYNEYYDDYFIDDDLTYCELGHEERRMEDTVNIRYYQEYATKEFFEEEMVKCDYYNKDEKDMRIVKTEDAIYLDLYDEYMTHSYKWEKLFVEDDEHEYIKKTDTKNLKNKE